METYHGAIRGKKGLDSFWFKLANGQEIPWPTKEELEEMNKEFPMPPQEEIDRIKELEAKRKTRLNKA